VNGNVALVDSSGATVTTLAFSLQPRGTVQITIPSGLSAVFGSAGLTHDGAPDSVTGGIYMVQPTGSGSANFRWPFTSVRAYGSTDSK
jgi:hypothetical protein